jgi:putative ABC transport system permease protein
MIDIPLSNLAIAFIPVALAIWLIWQQLHEYKDSLWAVGRMLIQLLIVGYALKLVFSTENSTVVLAVLLAMLLIGAAIAIRPLQQHKLQNYRSAAIALLCASLPVLAIAVFAVLQLDPWYQPRYLIPLGSMVLANTLNTISLSAERLESSLSQGSAVDDAASQAMKAGMIPVINSLFAVGLVALPGMMTGQVLSGVDPLIAARYQILIMCMLFAASAIGARSYIHLSVSRQND